MAQRKVTVVLYHEYGHPDNLPTKEAVFKVVTEGMASLLEKERGPLHHWHIESIKAE